MTNPENDNVRPDFCLQQGYGAATLDFAAESIYLIARDIRTGLTLSAIED